MRRLLVAALVVGALVSTPIGHADTAIDDLAKLPVHAADTKIEYGRDKFGPPWTDNNDDQYGHNGCDTRDDILARDLTNVVRDGKCTVVSGTLSDPYTGRRIDFHRGRETSSQVQIDHVVALGNAWITGAKKLSPQQRIDLANDPRNLLAVDGSTNESKRDGDASQWLPPNAGFRCAYVKRQVAVKAAYHLWLVPAERDAMARVLADDCK